jgi:hypothetical protein
MVLIFIAPSNPSNYLATISHQKTANGVYGKNKLRHAKRNHVRKFPKNLSFLSLVAGAGASANGDAELQ